MAKEDESQAGAPGRTRRFFMKQLAMQRMVYALVPVALSGVYFFGWRVLAVLVIANVAGILTEFITSRKRGRPISQAVFVTCFLYALALPPTVPLWIAAVGAVVGVLFGKEVFGGFGHNFANPAIVGRAFVYVCFPIELTGSFVPAFRGFPGGLAEWGWTARASVPEWLTGAAESVTDAVTSASPMWALRDFGYQASYGDLFLGTMGGTFEGEYGRQVLAAGSIGEGCAPLLILAGAYLLWTRTANWRLMLTPVAGAAAGYGLLWAAGVRDQQPLAFKLLAGAFVYVSVFMVPEPVSAPNRKGAMLAYGAVIGFLILVISWKSQFIAAASFAILLGNIMAPLFDLGAKAWSDRRKRAAKEAAGEGAAEKQLEPAPEEEKETVQVEREPEAEPGHEKKPQGPGGETPEAES